MEPDKQKEYYELLEKISDMTCALKFDRAEFIRALNQFCDLFHIEKGVTEFYQNPRMEELGEGEILVDRDTGKGDVILHQIRIVPDSNVVIKGILYVSKDEPPMSEEDLRRVDIVYRLVISFVVRKRLQRYVVRYALTDEDGFNNRRYLMRYIEQKIAGNEQLGNVAVCLNLRNFSAINREFGKKTGDIVMKRYYEFLQKEIGDKGAVGRLGGDNFVLFFRKEIKRHILDLLSGVPIAIDESGQKVTITARAGIFDINGDFPLDTPGQVMDKVYPAAQLAKQRDLTVVSFDRKMLEEREHFGMVQKKFWEGVAKKDVVAYYQPKVDITTGKIVGAEALCRWVSDGKMIMPGEFIPVLEMSNDICKLDFYMFEAVCADIRRWLDEGRNVPRISVNFSRKHLNNPDLLGYILEIINRYEIQRKYVEIELTETTSDVEFKDLRRIVNGLQREGIATSVDDFGNGYSSLNLIREIPWNVIKIDRALLPMDEEAESSITSRMYTHVLAMARDVGLECITEGVETMHQVEILKKNHCMTAQGFYFDKALPVKEFENRLDGAYYAAKLDNPG